MDVYHSLISIFPIVWPILEITLLMDVNLSPASISQIVWQILDMTLLRDANHSSASKFQIVWLILEIGLFMDVNLSKASISLIVWQILEIWLFLDVITFHPKSKLISKNVLAKKYLNNDCNRIQAQEVRKYIEEIPWCGDCWCYKPSYRWVGEAESVLSTWRNPRAIQQGLLCHVYLNDLWPFDFLGY